MSSETSTATSVLASTALSLERLETLSARVVSSSADRINVSAPATDEPFASIPACESADVAAAVERAREAQSAWADRSPADRAAVVDRFGDLVLDHREELLDLTQLETGKARRTAAEELLDVPMTCAYYADTGPDLVDEERRRGAFPGATSARVTYDPVGVVGVIAPWNYPLTLAVTDAIPALVAGNAVVLKPDEKTPFVALALAELLEEAGLPDGVLEVVTGEGAVAGPALIDSVDYVAFTGSTETGRTVAERAGRNLIDCSLELGGNNPLLVLDDADVEEAARGAVTACFTNAGQLCLAVERIYVVESRYDEFLDAFVGATRRLSLGTDFDYRADVGSLVDADQLARVEDHLSNAVDTGASVVSGGRHRPDVGPYCFEPTVLTDVDPDSTVACEETFGPVVSVTSVSDTEAAIAAANDSSYGLNASVWTSDRERGRDVARRLDCGTVCVNDAYISGWAAIDAPMGGFGDSGLGRRHGPEGMTRFLETRTIATSRIGPVTFPSGSTTKWALGAAFRLLGLQRRLRRWRR